MRTTLPFKDFRNYTTFQSSPSGWRVYYPNHTGYEITEEQDNTFKVKSFRHNYTIFKPKFKSSNKFHLVYTDDIIICNSADEVNELIAS